MGHYDTLDDGPTTQFSVYRVKVKRARTDGKALSERGNAVDYIKLRRAVPVTQPVPAAFKWIARLPKSVQPLNLLRQYPRVANNLALNWPDRKAFRHCLYDLLVDKRGGRQGFPAPVLQELLRLREWFDASDLARPHSLRRSV